jgi:hypothetical protein
MLLGAGLLLSFPLLVVAWPPSSDLSLHAGMVGLLAHHGDATFCPPGVYALALGHANQLLYLLAWPLALVVGAELACRLLLAGIVAASFVAAGRLAKHLGRSPWAALAIAPAVLGWSFYWGFVPQMLGLALWMAALPWLDEACERATSKRTLAASALVVLVGAAHVTSMLCAGLAIAVFALVRPLDRRTALRLAPSAVALLLTLVEDHWERRVATPLAQLFASHVLWHSPGRKLTGLVSFVAGGHGTITEATIGLLALVAAILWRLPERPPPATPPAGWRARLREHRFCLLLAALLLLYFAAPYSVNFGAFLYVRFLGPAFVLGVMLIAPRAQARGALVVAPALALFLAPVFAAVPQLQAAGVQSDAVSPLIDRIDEGSSVAVLHFGKYDHSLLFDPTSMGNRVLARRGGRLLSSFADYPIAPVVIRPEVRWDSILLRTSAKSGQLAPASDLARIRWVLVQVHEAPLLPLIVRGMAPEGELVEAAGEWLLFRSTLPPLPLDAPDGPAEPRAETLQDRVTRALHAPPP